MQCMYVHPPYLYSGGSAAWSASPVGWLKGKVEWPWNSITAWLHSIHIPECRVYAHVHVHCTCILARQHNFSLIQKNFLALISLYVATKGHTESIDRVTPVNYVTTATKTMELLQFHCTRDYSIDTSGNIPQADYNCMYIFF